MSKTQVQIANELALQIRSAFPAIPVPKYPPMMGMDPMGNDEYSAFANVAWTDVPPKLYGNTVYDISPPIGFSSHPSPHMWNYHLPGFITASLLHEIDCAPTDSFMWTMQDIIPKTNSTHDEKRNWWEGTEFNSNYTTEQCQMVVRYLEFMRDHGANEPYYYSWTNRDDNTLNCWTGLNRQVQNP